MGEIPDRVKEQVRAVLLSKTDGKGVLVTDFLRDYKNILKEPLMFKSLGYSTLPEFLKAIPDVCRLEYSESLMAFKLFGIAKPNTYASSFMKKAEGNMSDEESEPEDRHGGRGKQTKRVGELLSLGKDLDEEWKPNCRGMYTLCFPNRFKGLQTSDAVTVKFSEVGEVADINIISTLIFVRFKDVMAAKEALRLWGDELKLRRAEEKQPPPPRRAGGGDGGSGRGKRDKEELLVKSRPKTSDVKVNGRKTDSDESDYGSRSVRQNDHIKEEKKESIWAKVRQSENENQKDSGAFDLASDKMEKLSVDDNTNRALNTVTNSLKDRKEYLLPNPELRNPGLLGKNPDNKNSLLLDQIGQRNELFRQVPENQARGPGRTDENRTPVVNGLLAGPMFTVPLGRAAVLGRQATGQSTYVNPGPISRPTASSINQPRISPISQQEVTEPKISPNIPRQPVSAVINTQKANTGKMDAERTEDSVKDFSQKGSKTQYSKTVSSGEELRKKEEIAKDTQKGEKRIQVYLGNFPHTATQNDLEDLVRDYDCKGCRIVSSSGNKFKKFAFVEFVSAEEAERCIADLNEVEFQTRKLQVRYGSREEKKEGIKYPQNSPHSSQPSPVQKSPAMSKPGKDWDDDADDDDEMPELETDVPDLEKPKSGRQPGSYVPKTPEHMPPLEQMSPISPGMPVLEEKTPPRRKQPLLATPIPSMPQPDSGHVFDSRDLEEKLLNDSEEDESIQLFVSNFPYGKHENDIVKLFEKGTVSQIVMMNSSITNRSTYAFVTVKNIEMAQFAILQLDQSLMEGRRLTVGMATPMACKKSNPADPITRITCTVGATGDSERRVSVDDTFTYPSKGCGYMPNSRGYDRGGYTSGFSSDGYMSESGYSRPDYDRPRMHDNRQHVDENMRQANTRMTYTLKSYAMIVSKLHGEQDFAQPVNSQMVVHVTHVEENGFFFWGQVLVDETFGARTNIETLKRITFELQERESRTGPMRGLGRCAALYQGQWYRAWNLNLTEDGLNNVFYLDYGNLEAVPSAELCSTAPNIWNLPPIAKPFKQLDAAKSGGSMKGLENRTVEVEVNRAGDAQNWFRKWL